MADAISQVLHYLQLELKNYRKIIDEIDTLRDRAKKAERIQKKLFAKESAKVHELKQEESEKRVDGIPESHHEKKDYHHFLKIVKFVRRDRQKVIEDEKTIEHDVGKYHRIILHIEHILLHQIHLAESFERSGNHTSSRAWKAFWNEMFKLQKEANSLARKENKLDKEIHATLADIKQLEHTLIAEEKKEVGAGKQLVEDIHSDQVVETQLERQAA